MSHPEQETLQDLAAAYALGALSAEEARRFEAYLAGSPEAQREVAEYREKIARSLLTGVREYLHALSRNQTRQLTSSQRDKTGPRTGRR